MTAQGFQPLLQRLVEAQVEFVLVGGLAINAWGHLRGTKDVDIVPDPSSENLERLTRVLEDAPPLVVGDKIAEPSAIKLFLRTGDKTLVRTTLGEIDILQGLSQIPRYEELAVGAVSAELEGKALEIAHPEDLESR